MIIASIPSGTLDLRHSDGVSPSHCGYAEAVGPYVAPIQVRLVGGCAQLMTIAAKRPALAALPIGIT
jgi:hypothetical protein